tara:strand:+ start:267 stop:581 length:315 start_codon:yes stop_codon:yes gene_type:complete
MKYVIDAVRCYQSVMFDKRQETFFATRQINNKQPIELEIIEELQMVSIKSESDHILIPLTNVSAIYLKSPIKLEQAKKDAEERAKMPTPTVIKKPRVKQTAYRS